MTDRHPPVYLDWNATTPPLDAVVDAMAKAARHTWGNPSSVHAAGRAARAVVEEAREAVARLVGCEARDVVLTSGGTEANNLALHDAEALVTSRIEHPSVVRVAEALAARGRTVRWIDVPRSGHLDVQRVKAALDGLPRGARVAVMAANHETGAVQPISEIARVVREAGMSLHCDAVQAVGKTGSWAWEGASSVAVAAHKFRGPKGMGALCLLDGRRPAALLVGGSQERGLRPGTVDPVAAAGLAVAAEAARSGPERHATLATLRDRLERSLHGLGQSNGMEPRLPHVVSWWFPGHQADALVAALDLEGVRASSGSACAAGTSEPSPVVTAMYDVERARSSLRLTLGETTSAEDVEYAIRVVRRVVEGHAPGP